MGKKKNRKNRRQDETLQQSVLIPEGFDYQKFADAMVNAQLKAKEKENELTEQKKKEADAEWRRIIGHKDYAADTKWPIRFFYELRNDIVLLFRILFFKKENAKYDVATFALLKLSLSAVFVLFKLLLYLIAIVCLGTAIYSVAQRAFSHSFMFLCVAFLSYMIARVIRIAQFEIDNLKDRGYLIGILSAVTSFVAMILALLALLRQTIWK